jgi:hypothetical protein
LATTPFAQGFVIRLFEAAPGVPSIVLPGGSGRAYVITAVKADIYTYNPSQALVGVFITLADSNQGQIWEDYLLVGTGVGLSNSASFDGLVIGSLGGTITAAFSGALTDQGFAGLTLSGYMQ